MFQEGNYNVLEFTPPAQGMNRNIAPQLLPKDFASALENILPTPLGSATVRYGTKLLEGMNLPPDASILEAFPFSRPNGDKQIVLYVQTFVQDASAQNFVVLSPNSFQFDTNEVEKFTVDTPIKIEYTSLGVRTLYSAIVSKDVNQQTVTITVQDNSFPMLIDDVEINHLSFSQGNIYIYDFQTQTLGNVIKTGLSVGCVPRSVTFLNTLLICNGVDKVLSWDGATLKEVVDFVKENGAINFNRIDNTHFSFSLSPVKASIFDITKYQNNNVIRLNINEVIFEMTVSAIQEAQNVITITTVDNLPNFVSPPVLLYRDWPPAFSFMLVAHNRLWALGSGAVGLTYRDPSEALRVYFSYRHNSLTDWFNEEIKAIPILDLSINHGSPDNLEAIGYINGLMVFMGRNKTQVWTGSEPKGGEEAGNQGVPFVFSSVLPIGIVHGNLLVEMVNDLYFVSQNGLLSFSTLNVAKQFAATSSDAVDPLIRDYIRSLTNSTIAYRACRAFKYKSGAFCGFKIGLNKVLVSLYSTNLYAWSLFSGDFSKAQTFLASLDNSLYLFIGNTIYQYADGSDSVPVYGDNNGQDLISFLWIPPVVNLPGKRFANKRYEIQVEYPSSFVLNSKNTLSINIDGDLSKTFALQDVYGLQFKGDSLGMAPFVNPADIGNDPNEPNPNAVGLRLDDPYAFSKRRLKFVSSSFTVNLVGSTFSGPLIFKKIKLFGIGERHA